MDSGGKKTVCVQIPYALYLQLKEEGIVMSEVMRKALENTVNKNEPRK